MTSVQQHGLAQHPMAFLSDIHGNLPALEAVLEALDTDGVRAVYVAGDLLLGGDSALEVWRRLEQLGARCTRGPSDIALARIDPGSLEPRDAAERGRADAFAATREAIGDLVVEQLRRLPDKLRIPLIDGTEVLMVHGSPADPSQEIGHDLSDEQILALLADDPADIVVCGASHVPFLRSIDEVQVVNVGSVGAAPEGRVAHYSVLTPHMSGAEIHQRWVDY